MELTSRAIKRPGRHPPWLTAEELDGLVAGRRRTEDWIAKLEEVERERTGIKSLKVGYNKVFGYYIEVTNANRRRRARRLHPQADAGQRRALHHARS